MDGWSVWSSLELNIFRGSSFCLLSIKGQEGQKYDAGSS